MNKSCVYEGFSGMLPKRIRTMLISRTLYSLKSRTLSPFVGRFFTRSMSSETGQEETSSEDAPIDLAKNPYEKEKKKCLLCRTGIDLDYKNARLLQQFVSTFSGRVYDRHITGLCDGQQKKLIETIALSRKAGYMSIFVKDPKYVRDPKLFDPLRPIKPHSFA